MGHRNSGNGGGGAPRARTITRNVPLQSGLLTTLSRFGLRIPITFAKTGGSGNLSIDGSSGAVSAASALSAGASQSLLGKVTGADGCVIPFSASLTGLALSAPVTVAPPTISGAAKVGQILTCSNGSWSNAPVSYTYQWYFTDSETPIEGATNATYAPVSTDVGHLLSCTVTAVNAVGATSVAAVATSAISALASLGVLDGSFSLPEDAAEGVVAGSIMGTTPGSTLSLSDDAAGRVALSGKTIVRGATALDYENATSHSFTIVETLAGALNSPRSTTFSLAVNNVLEGAALSDLAGTFELPEDAPAGALAGPIVGKAAGSTLSLVGDAGGRIALSGSDIVRGATALDYETATSHSFTVRETLGDSANSPHDTVLTLAVGNVLEAMVLSDLSGSFALAEDAVVGVVAGTLVGTAAGSTLALISDAGGRVALSGTTIVHGATALDYETATSHSFTVRETLGDSANSPHDTVLTLAVTNVLEAPTLGDLSGNFTLKEDAAAGATAGALVGKTPGSTLALVGDAGGRVALSGATIVRGATALDYETATSHSFTVRETLGDSANSPHDTVLTLAVTDVAEQANLNPLSLSAPTVVSGTASGMVVSALLGGTSGSTFSLSDSAGGRFALSSGNLVTGLTATDFVSASSHSIVVTETLPGSANSPRSTTLTITVQQAAMPDASRTAMISTLSGGRDADQVIPTSYWDNIQAGSENPDQHPSLGTATHNAIKSGNWSDPTVWDAGAVPGAGHIASIGGTYAVVYDHQMPTGSYADPDALAAAYKAACAVLQSKPAEATALAAIAAIEALALKGVHVGGTAALTWATGLTYMLVDTIMAHGTFEMGTEAAPILDSGIVGQPRARVTFVGTKDPTTSVLLGLNTMARVRIWGEQKTDRAEMSIDPTVGATQVTLAQPAVNWRVGDVIVITSTQLAGNANSDSAYSGPTSAFVPYHAGSAVVFDYSYYRQFTASVFKQSRDEVRTITGISADRKTITFDNGTKPLAFDHPTFNATTPRGVALSICSYCCNLSRSIRFEGLYPNEKGVTGTGRHRPHIMFMYHDDIKVHWAEAKRMGRSRTDPTLWSEQNTDQQGLKSSSSGSFLADVNNVRGRYGFHFHWCGPFLGMKMSELVGASVWSPLDENPGPGWGITHHNSRATIENCTVFNVRGAGIVSELGSEIGQWLDCTSIYCRGDGYMPDWGSRQEIIANHNGSSGVGFQNQARQIMMRGCVAVSCNIGFDWLQQSTTTDMTMRSPEDTAMRMFDPITQGLSATQGKANYMPEMISRYGNKQTQIPDFHDCKAIDVRWGFMVANRDNMDNEDVMPMVSKHFVVYASEIAYNIIQYSFNYFFYDYFFKGPGVNSGNSAKFFGTKTFNFNFTSGVVMDFTRIVEDYSFNYYGFFVDIVGNFTSVSKQIEQTITFTDDINKHPNVNTMGPWVVTSTNPLKAIVRSYNILHYPGDFPQALPIQPIGPGAFEPLPGTTRPYFYPDPGNSGTITPNGLGTIHFRGYIVDGYGSRKWPDYQRFLDTTVVTGAYDDGGRFNANANGIDLVRRNGCYQRNGSWYLTLWFVDADRATGEHIVFGLEFPIGSGFDATYLAAHRVADANATKPVMPLLPEARRVDDAPTVRTSPNVFTFTAQSEVARNAAVTSNEITVTRLTPGQSVAVSISGGLYSKNGGAFTNAADTAKKGDSFAVQVQTGSRGGLSHEATLTIGDKSATFAAVTENVSATGAIFTDFFDRSGDENLSASSNWELVSGNASQAFITASDQTLNAGTGSGQTVAVRYATDFGSLNQYAECNPSSNSGFSNCYVCVNFTDASNWIGMRVGASSVLLYKMVSGNLTQIGTWNLSNPQAASRYRVQYDAATGAFSVYQNGVVCGQGTITSPPGASSRQGIVLTGSSGKTIGHVCFGTGEKNVFTDSFARSSAEDIEVSTNYTRIDGAPGMLTAGPIYLASVASNQPTAYRIPDRGHTRQAASARLNSFTPGFLCCQLTDKDNFIGVNFANSASLKLVTKVAGSTKTQATVSTGGANIDTAVIRLEYDPATGNARVYRNFNLVIDMIVPAGDRPPVTTYQGFTGGQGVRTLARYSAFEAY